MQTKDILVSNSQQPQTNDTLRLNSHQPLEQKGPAPIEPITSPIPVVQIVNMPMKLPFDVSSELSNYTRAFITKNTDFFRTFHCCEARSFDYNVFGELPDGHKVLLFTVRLHFKFCDCCNDCIIPCILCDYVCCDKIIFQLDYRVNNYNFYTQGVNLQKGCYCCKCQCCNYCNCCCCCCCNCGFLYSYRTLFLRENLDPDNPDFDVGIKKGTTLDIVRCCCCQDKVVKYFSQEGIEGHTLRLDCCEILKRDCICTACCTRCYDLEIAIENPSGQKVGNIFIPNGCCSTRVENCCYSPGNHFEINFPKDATSFEKFQIIAEAIHFNLSTGLI